jgi:hypothetical protein
MLFQLGALFLGVGLLLFTYIIAYIIAIIYSAVKSSKAIMQENSLKASIRSLLLFLVANLILFLIYIPTLLYNPEINWKLKGEVEQDPIILQAYVPPVLFVIAAVIIISTIFVSKVVSFYKTERMRTIE